MLTRRQFLEGSAAGAAGLALGRAAFAKLRDRPLGVQLYTVREPLQHDVEGTLRAIRRIGYQTVEAFAGEYNRSAADLRRAILNAGLAVPSAHFNYGDFGARFGYAKELGVEYMVCAMISPSVANSAEGYKRAAAQYNAWGEQARKVGLRFAFHNHDMEFKPYGDGTGFDILMENTDPALVAWEMDCYWVAQAGRDPVTMLHKYGQRIRLLHLKDRKPNVPTSTDIGPGSAHFTEIGTGTLDWPAILTLADQFEIRHVYVEQDQTERPPLESLRISYTNLEKYLHA